MLSVRTGYGLRAEMFGDCRQAWRRWWRRRDGVVHPLERGRHPVDGEQFTWAEHGSELEDDGDSGAKMVLSEQLLGEGGGHLQSAGCRRTGGKIIRPGLEEPGGTCNLAFGLWDGNSEHG